MKDRLQIPWFSFYVTSCLMVVVFIVSFINALSWINKPFAGFLIYRPPYVGSISVSDWPGRQAGLSFLEKVVAADGKPVDQGQDVVSLARNKTPGAQIQYQVESKIGKREVSVPVAIFTIEDFLLAFFVTFAGGVVLFILGFFVVLLKPNIKPSWVFFALCSGVGGYMVTSFEILTTYILLPFHYLALCFMPAPFLHLALIFPDRKRILERFPWLEYAGYLPALILTAIYQIFHFTQPQMAGSQQLVWFLDYQELGTLARLFALFSVVSLIVSVCHSLFKASSPSGRQRAKVILFGVTIAFLPSTAVMMGFYLMKVNFPWNFLVFFIIFFPASIAYSIVKHNLFDADVMIRRTVGYVVVTAVILAAYALVSLGLNLFMAQYELARSRAFPILFTIAVILVFNPLRDRIQALVDRFFFRKEYDYGAVVEKVSRAITTLLDQGQVLRHLTRTFIEDMFIDTTSVMLLNPATAEYSVYLADGERKLEVEGKSFKSKGPLMQIIEGERKELTRYDVLEDPKYKAISQPCAEEFESVHASLMIPLVFQDKLIGVLNFGEKKSGKPYNRQDIDLLHAVANQGAVAIENARLLKENLDKQRMEEELSIARDLQTSMLPASCPAIEGFQIAAISIPAREVGGDFYDFIEMGDRKAGFVIGDVTGKSVSGALVMAASRSVFRILSEQNLSLGEIMTRANQRTKKDIKSGMFVALLYAVLDAENRTMSLCSAGQTQPVYLRADTGEASLVQTEGDTFPLGILEDADYQETIRQLERGDKVVLYTDGIVEAMNAQEEMFGFERLMEVVKESRPMSADELLKEIIARVTAFAGGAPQHDDLTIIVIATNA